MLAILVVVIFVNLNSTLFKVKNDATQLPKNSLSRNIREVKGTSVENKLAITPSPSPTPLPRNSLYLGFWTQGFWDNNSKTLHPEKLIQIENEIGKKVAIANYYRGWEALGSDSIVNELNKISDNGWRPMISANPYFFDKCQSNGEPLYKAIAHGNCDEFLHSVGRSLKAFGKPLFLRFAWEMNIPSMSWEIRKVNSTNQDFILAWRKFHDIVYSEGATNVLWIFSPSIITPESISYHDIYPGDGYVDWIALDGYNWGTTQPWSKWETFEDIFLKSYTSITAVAPIKPLMIAEIGSTSKGGKKSDWILDTFLKQLSYNYPKIKAVVYYNEDRTNNENVNWLIDENTAILTAFRTAVSISEYKSGF